MNVLIIGYFLFLLMGIVMGLLGGGGAIITLPLLVYFFEVRPIQATHYSLFIVGVAAFFAGLSFIIKEGVDFKKILTFLVPSLLSVYIARKVLLPLVPEEFSLLNTVIPSDTFLLFLFALLMLGAGLRMLSVKVYVHNKENNYLYEKLAFSGVLVGFIAGFFGAGGGFLIVPALILFVGFEVKKAIGHSLVIISLQSLFGFFLGGLTKHKVNWDLLLYPSVIAVVGILIGSFWMRYLSSHKLKNYFAYFIIVMGLVLGTHQVLK